MSISNSTITENSLANLTSLPGALAPLVGGGIDNNAGGTLLLFDTIVSGNTSLVTIGTHNYGGSGPDIYGAVSSASSYNLIGDSSNSTGWSGSLPNLLDVPADLDPTFFSPLTGSPALDAGSLASAPALDVFGDPRVLNNSIDIGAVEATQRKITFTVNTAADDATPATNPGSLSLREALELANGSLALLALTPAQRAQVQVQLLPPTAPSTDLITFDTCTFSTSQTILLGPPDSPPVELPLITGRVNVVGPGSALLAIDGQSHARIFDIASGANVVISALSINDADPESSGGGIRNLGALSLSQSILTGDGSGGSGGGVYNAGRLTVTNTSFDENFASYGGAVYNQVGGTLTTNGVQIEFGYAHRGAGIYNAGAASMTNSRVYDNFAGSSDSDPAYGSGAGIANTSSGTLTLTDSTVTGNTAEHNGGGIENQGRLTVTRSYINDNTSNYGDGGGIWDSYYFGSETEPTGQLTIVDSNISGNASQRGNGGGVYLYAYNPAGNAFQISNSTISRNFAYDNAGGIDVIVGGENVYANPLLLFDSIVEGNWSGGVESAADLYGPVNENSSYNLVGYANDFGTLTGAEQNLIGVSADLDPSTFVPMPGSLAIDAGSNANAPTVDLFGDPRIVNGVIDIGAVETAAASTVSIVNNRLVIDASPNSAVVVDGATNPGAVTVFINEVPVDFDGSSRIDITGLDGISVYLSAGTNSVRVMGDISADLFGGIGTDSLFGGDGENTFFAGTGRETLNGGTGTNEYVVGVGNAGINTTVIIPSASSPNQLIINDADPSLANVEITPELITLSHADQNHATIDVFGAIDDLTVQTQGSQFYANSVILGAPTTVDSSTGDVSFNGSVDGGFDLSVTDDGQTDFGDQIGSTTPLASLEVNSAGNSSFASTVQVAGGISVTSGGSATFFELIADDFINVESGGESQFFGEISTATELTISSGGATDIEDDVFADSDISISSGSSTTITGTIFTPATLTISSGSSTTLGGSVTADDTTINSHTADTEFDGNVSINGALLVNSFGATRFEAPVFAADGLTANSGDGGTQFAGSVNVEGQFAITSGGVTILGGQVIVVVPSIDTGSAFGGEPRRVWSADHRRRHDGLAW